MARDVNKSWSSFHVSAKGNANPRNSETSNPMRRSFSGNPFVKPSISINPKGFIPNTPANSPSDFPPRKSFSGRENVLSFNVNEDKENGKEQNLKQRIRSPDLKGAKHFMSPTISASSKVTVSPRKKVLVERNESARTSVSACDVKTAMRRVTFSETKEEIDFKPEIGFEVNKFQSTSDMLCRDETLTDPLVLEDLKSEEVHHSDEPSSTKMEPELLPYDEIVTGDPHSVNLDPTFKISPTPPVSNFHSISDVLAPLDADSLIPPYDPKTNYLSPRPQFLHYRPNPRVALCKEKEGTRLEDCFSSGSSSDVEENQSDGSLKESEDFSSSSSDVEENQSDGSLKESEDFSSRGNKEEEGRVTELSPRSVETEMKKGSTFTRSKFIALVLVLSVVGLSISDSILPVSESPVFEDMRRLYKNFDSSYVTDAAKAKLEGIARDWKALYARQMFLFSAYVTNFRGPRGLNPFPYGNLTTLLDDSIDGYLTFDLYGDKGTVDSLQLSLQEVRNVEDGTAQKMEIMDNIFTEEDSECEEQVQGYVRVNDGQEQDGESGVLEVVTEEEAIDGSRVPIVDSTYEELGAMEVEMTAEIGDASRGYFDLTHEEVPQRDETAETGFGSEETGEASGGFSSSLVFEEDIPQDVASGTTEKGSVVLPLEEAIGSSLVPVVELAKSEEFNLEKAEVELGRKEPDQAQENAGEVNRGNDLSSAADMELQGETKEISRVYSQKQEEQQKSEVGRLQPLLIAIMVLVLPLGAASLYLRTRNGKSLKQTEASSSMQHVKSTAPDNASVDLPYSRNCTTEVNVAGGTCSSDMSSCEINTEVNVVGGTCSSDMSSCEINTASLFPKGSKRPSEGHKNMENTKKKKKKNYRRESFASSSSEYSTEPSYGSFSTYEKIQMKNGLGDEKQCLTPVRRSSRIRKATSPS